MNVRLSSDSVRWRVTKEEATSLWECQGLKEAVRLPGRTLELVVQLKDELPVPGTFSASEQQMVAVLKRSELARLLDSSAPPRSQICASLGPSSTVNFIFEIDLHS